MECTFGDLLERAIEVGAIDRWSDDGLLYEFNAGTRVFRMRRADGAGFLRALITRRQMEVLTVHTGIADVAERPRPGADALNSKSVAGYKKLFRRVVALSDVRSSYKARLSRRYLPATSLHRTRDK